MSSDFSLDNATQVPLARLRKGLPKVRIKDPLEAFFQRANLREYFSHDEIFNQSTKHCNDVLICGPKDKDDIRQGHGVSNQKFTFTQLLFERLLTFGCASSFAG